MAVDTPHPQYTKALTEWKKVRDCLGGTKTVKAAGKEYLPMLAKQESEDYKKYLCRALFFNATARTEEAMIGLLFRKPPEMDLPGLDPIVADANLKGDPWVIYARQVSEELCSVGRCGTLIDWSDAESRPYAAFYCAEAIINWRTERIGGKTLTTLVVLKEEQEVFTAADPFTPTLVEQWRVLRLNVVTTPGAEAKATTMTYVAEIWRRQEEGKDPVLMESKTPTRKNGTAQLDAIPFVFHNADNNGPDIGRVPLADLSEVNLSHYRTSADLENGRHVCGVPTPYAFGLDKNKEAPDPALGTGATGNTDREYYLGSSYAWTSDNENATAGFLEFTGAGLAALENAIKEKEGQMAALGARLIEPRSKDAEAYETVALRATAEASTLARIGIQSTGGLLMALAWMNWWGGKGDDVTAAANGLTFAINKDFVSSTLTPLMLTALVSARQANQISMDTFFYNMQRGEMYKEGWKLEDETDKLENEPPMPAPLPTPPIDPNQTDPKTGLPLPKPIDPNPKPPVRPPARKPVKK